VLTNNSSRAIAGKIVIDVSNMLALATFRAACERWPGIPIPLQQGARVIEDSWCLRIGLLV